MESLALKKEQDFLLEYESKFARIFKLLNEAYGENVFKRYQEGKLKGPVIISAFESIVPGVYRELDYWEKNVELLKNKIITLYSQEQYKNATRRGTRALDRMCQLIKFSRVWFADED